MLTDYKNNPAELNKLIELIKSDDWFEPGNIRYYAIFRYGTIYHTTNNNVVEIAMNNIKKVVPCPGTSDSDIFSYYTPKNIIFIASNAGFENVQPGISDGNLPHLLCLRAHYFADVENPEIIHSGYVHR